jgi:Transposase DDE domain
MPNKMSILFSNFLQEFDRINILMSTKIPCGRKRRPPHLLQQEIIAGLAWHVMQPSGTFAHSVEMLTQKLMSESALSERRQSLGTEPWKEALKAALRPLADPVLHPHAFYKGFRLVGVDGTTMNVANTPPMKNMKVKTQSRRGSAAFHRIGCAALVELGTHSPLALRIGENDDSESVLAALVVEHLTVQDLIIADRYYGNGKWAGQFLEMPQKPKFLLRVQERFKAAIMEELSDGSRIVAVQDPQSDMPILLREVKGKVRRPGKKWIKVRFWTNLIDEVCYPAEELIALYALRWEQEIAFREIKEHLYGDNILLSHTPVTAVQEICALFMAQAMVSRARCSVGINYNVPIMMVSYKKTLDACRNLCWLVTILGVNLTKHQMDAIIRHIEKDLAKQLSPPRRKRSCPRAVRQPVNKWPRLMKNSYDKGDFEYEVRKS